MKKYNIKDLEEKLKICKEMDLSEVNIEQIDDLSEIKISRKKQRRKNYRFYK